MADEQMNRSFGHDPTNRWPDGCPKPEHVRDAICALGKVEMPPADEPEPEGDRGGST